MSDWVSVCRSNGIAPGEWVTVDVDGAEVAVFNIDGEFYAIEDVCTHDGACLVGDPIEGEEVICPRHGARFNIKTGAVLSAPAYEDVATFPVQIVDDMIQVRDERWD